MEGIAPPSIGLDRILPLIPCRSPPAIGSCFCTASTCQNKIGAGIALVGLLDQWYTDAIVVYVRSRCDSVGVSMARGRAMLLAFAGRRVAR
jgi:hypothetical protein